MADESTQSAVLERPSEAASPATASSPGSGLGAEASEESTRKQSDETLSKLQAKADRAEARAAAAEDAHARALAQIGDTQSARQIGEYERGAPDADMDPAGNARYWREVAYRIAQAQQQERVNQTTTQRSEAWIAEKLAEVEVETGVKVARNDERLVLMPGAEGRRRFLASVERIKGEINASKSTEARIKAEARKLADEELKKAGIDRFDGGGTGGATYDGCPTTLKGIQDLTPQQYAKFAPRIRELWAAGQLTR